jgi:hypothetical protein
MRLTDDERDAVVAFRVQKAKDTLEEAEGIASLCYWNAVANRLYSKLFDLRQTGDYDDLFNLNEEDVKLLIVEAKRYINEI